MTRIIEEGDRIGSCILACLGHAAEQTQRANRLALAEIFALQDREADASQCRGDPVAIVMGHSQATDRGRIGQIAEHHCLTVRIRAGDPCAACDLGVGQQAGRRVGNIGGAGKR